MTDDTNSQRFEFTYKAANLIHNDLLNAAYSFVKAANEKHEPGADDYALHDMLASITFTAFAGEAAINFLGHKLLLEGWPERANFKEKLRLVYKVLDIPYERGQAPLQNVMRLHAIRNVLAHGKPEYRNETLIIATPEPHHDYADPKWLKQVNLEFVNDCYKDTTDLFDMLRDKAGISVFEAMSGGSYSLSPTKEQ